LPKSKTTTQTVRIGGKRTILKTVNGKVTAKPAPVEEWVLQAAAVRRLRQMPEYGSQFTLAGDMNAARRSMNESAKAVATGLAAGDPDLRIYGAGGRLLLIEYKGEKGKLTTSQGKRHPLLARLGHPVTVIQASTEDECADATERLVRGWLGADRVAANDNTAVANDNSPAIAQKRTADGRS
jgi:hypothetical protein